MTGTWPLRREPASAAEARGLARSFIGRTLGAADKDAVLLVVSELVTNAVQHGDDPIELSLAMARGSVRVEVEDGGHRAPAMSLCGNDEVSGRGLGIVAALGRWGCEPIEGNGKRVWCDVGTGGAPAQS